MTNELMKGILEATDIDNEIMKKRLSHFHKITIPEVNEKQ